MHPGIREHMEVIGSDGGHIGRVDHFEGDEFDIVRFDFGGGLEHHLIPENWVADVVNNKVRLNLTKDAARAAWSEVH